MVNQSSPGLIFIGRFLRLRNREREVSPPLFLHLKARTFLRPLHRFHLPVSIHIRAQIPMSHHPRLRIIHLQRTYQYPQRVSLPFRPGVLCQPVTVQSTLITDTDRVSIVPTRVGTDPLDRACGPDITVTANVEMIANAIKATEAVGGVQVVLGKGAVLAGGTAMDDD